MPDWLVEFLKQSPVLGVCLGIVYLAWKYNQAIHTSYLEALEKSHMSHLASKDAEIRRLCDELEAARKERDKLVKTIAGKEKEKS